MKDVLRSVKVNDVDVIEKRDLNDRKSLFVVATLQDDVNDLVLETKGKDGISLTVLKDPLAELPSRGSLNFNLSEGQLHSIGTNVRVNVEGAEFSQQYHRTLLLRNCEER